VWVVTRHEADYRAALVAGDEVEVRTCVAPTAQGPLWARFVDIYKTGEEKPVVQIKSNWCLLDAQTRRVRRVPLEIIERFTG
jgi:acyl-CoA thioester hydrolase